MPSALHTSSPLLSSRFQKNINLLPHFYPVSYTCIAPLRPVPNTYSTGLFILPLHPVLDTFFSLLLITPLHLVPYTCLLSSTPLLLTLYQMPLLSPSASLHSVPDTHPPILLIPFHHPELDTCLLISTFLLSIQYQILASSPLDPSP